MTEDEIKAIDQRLAAMSERCDRVIAKEKPLGKPMPVLDFKPRSRPVVQARSQSAPRARYVPPDPDEFRADFVDYIHSCSQDGSIEQIFADFERQFDEMAQAHRYRS